ncbi:DUF2267 domain-containing protein [Saccharothrix deserti]|uniref:DUF2267 domain-containing protein n=1 Tax=Saccharothrix deserti TaxID=2593674 RepID=UPI00131B9C7A|nr:DUF2267 domain-containing protein [Saccharothrix deserti]
MKEHELVSAVRESTGIGSTDDAERAVRATLQVLGRRLTGGETRHLASQLPPALSSALPEEGAGERFGVEEFYQRVAAEEGRDCTPRQARQHARAVVTALRNTLPQGEVDDFAAQLPADYADLLSTGPVHH